jgi:hypothetical protein
MSAEYYSAARAAVTQGSLGSMSYLDSVTYGLGVYQQQANVANQISWQNIATAQIYSPPTITFSRTKRAVERLRDEISAWHGDALGRKG